MGVDATYSSISLISVTAPFMSLQFAPCCPTGRHFFLSPAIIRLRLSREATYE